MKNQTVFNAPKLGEGQRWEVQGYLLGKGIRKCPRKFSEFSTIQYISFSDGYYHFIGDGDKVVVCSIRIECRLKDRL